MSSDASSVPPEAGAEVVESAPLRARLTVMLGVAAAVFVADQLTKWWALEALADGPIDLVGSLRFNLVFNQGASFSIGGDGGWGPLISVFVVAVVVFLFFQVRSMRSTLGVVALGLVLGGALGNLADRLFRSDDGFLQGAVVDFIDLQWWPVFNIADAGVVVGALLLVATSLRSGPP